MTEQKSLRQETAETIVDVVKGAGRNASFSRILLECRRRGAAKWHRTLRKYLDLMVLGGVLRKSTRNVGSVFPMELYAVKSTHARIQVGLSVLIYHGLNWEIEEPDIVSVYSDIAGLVRAKSTRLSSHMILAGCLEDCLAYELKRDAREQRGTSELLVPILATMPLDLSYVFDRADRIGVGRTMRVLFRGVSKAFVSPDGISNGRAFLTTRGTFLRLMRQYSRSGALKLLDKKGKGIVGIGNVSGLSESTIVNLAAKQLGVIG
jgi:hypothetical protein